jgi:kynurenine formamidase
MCVPGCQEHVRAALTRRGFFNGAAGAAFAGSGLGWRPAQAQTPVQRSFSRVFDLTHTMSADFPTFFGEPGIAMEKKFDFKKDGFNLYWWHLLEHAGTHMDAPIHFSENGSTSERIPPDALVVPLAVIDVEEKAKQNADYRVTRDDLALWERKHGKLPENCCVAMHSGWAAHVGDAAKFTGKDGSGMLHFPGFGIDAAEWLMKERQVAGLAVDTLSLDHGPSKDFKVHHAWLPSERWGLENIANLDKVPPAGATLVVGLAKVKGATGGAARVIALV